MLHNICMIESLGQWGFVLIIALIIFGPKRMPELGRQLGSALRELNKVKTDMLNQINSETEEFTETFRYPENLDYSTPAYSAPHNETPVTDLSDYTIVGVTPVDDAVAEPVKQDSYKQAYPGFTPDTATEPEEHIIKTEPDATVNKEQNVSIEGESHV